MPRKAQPFMGYSSRGEAASELARRYGVKEAARMMGTTTAAVAGMGSKWRNATAGRPSYVEVSLRCETAGRLRAIASNRGMHLQTLVAILCEALSGEPVIVANLLDDQ